ncbi:MAG: hypothetical protein VKL01_07030 [Limnothrix sp.]|jgi:hypothetical protein|uniref:Uncharacterized protein n=1 Tax=Limnothrix redekei LRLZ20PSL1 TaxID=3112953 RepID=A0ABW7C5H2_9CYAN|nr:MULTISPECIES: hypothetical protein [unclassified Limnothrix]MEB3118102.1 hypothetical protein [Limnothrix sp.]OCQ95844.1 hypothetical protein BCR12_16880 [Limnothrix sp. P13C2]RFP56095.1 MAG: hypothetical protein BJG00_014355 [Limnothrix sp. CACIAM 69d]MBD2161960.1 hypothetical protein [Limnothrix sp. FACHB-1083]MBD2192853.1 hypothetical protein [Limnothrix sp. FACHB-1088]
MISQAIARYIEGTDSSHKPWLLVQLRLAKLEEQRDRLSPAEYSQALADIHQDLMNLGEWWVGREQEMFRPHGPGGNE